MFKMKEMPMSASQNPGIESFGFQMDGLSAKTGKTRCLRKLANYRRIHGCTGITSWLRNANQRSTYMVHPDKNINMTTFRIHKVESLAASGTTTLRASDATEKHNLATHTSSKATSSNDASRQVGRRRGD
jgi:hypothetical protein